MKLSSDIPLPVENIMYKLNPSPVATTDLLSAREKFAIGSGISRKSKAVAERMTGGRFRRLVQEADIVGKVSPGDVNVCVFEKTLSATNGDIGNDEALKSCSVTMHWTVVPLVRSRYISKGLSLK